MPDEEHKPIEDISTNDLLLEIARRLNSDASHEAWRALNEVLRWATSEIDQIMWSNLYDPDGEKEYGPEWVPLVDLLVNALISKNRIIQGDRLAERFSILGEEITKMRERVEQNADKPDRRRRCEEWLDIYHRHQEMLGRILGRTW